MNCKATGRDLWEGDGIRGRIGAKWVDIQVGHRETRGEKRGVWGGYLVTSNLMSIPLVCKTPNWNILCFHEMLTMLQPDTLS